MTPKQQQLLDKIEHIIDVIKATKHTNKSMSRIREEFKIGGTIFPALHKLGFIEKVNSGEYRYNGANADTDLAMKAHKLMTQINGEKTKAIKQKGQQVEVINQPTTDTDVLKQLRDITVANNHMLHFIVEEINKKRKNGVAQS